MELTVKGRDVRVTDHVRASAIALVGRLHAQGTATADEAIVTKLHERFEDTKAVRGESSRR